MSTAKKEMPAGAALSPFDAADYLHTPEDVTAFLEAVLEDYDGDSRVIVKALGVAARALGMQQIAKETGLNREGLYQALSGKGNPSFDTVLKVMNAVGVEFRPKLLTRRRPDGQRRAPTAKAGRKKTRTRLAPTKQTKRAQSSSTKARRSR
jgi:probable addiction module antidote protein